MDMKVLINVIFDIWPLGAKIRMELASKKHEGVMRNDMLPPRPSYIYTSYALSFWNEARWTRRCLLMWFASEKCSKVCLLDQDVAFILLSIDLDSKQLSTCLQGNVIGKIYATQIFLGSFGSPVPSNGLRRFGKSVDRGKILGLHCQRWFS